MIVKWILTFALVGLLIPIFCWVLSYSFRFLFGLWTVIIWPSSIILMATSGNEKSLGSFLIAVVAVVINMILYAGIGAAAYGISRFFSTW
jgi:hypothetical protein